MSDRHTFLRTVAGGAAALLATRLPSLAAATECSDAHIDVLLDAPLGVIAPEIYGHFTENLGAVIRGGVWVGHDAKIANIDGIRLKLVEAMREIRPGTVRFPGGCFADSYDWRDGIGLPSDRPRRTNFWVDNEAAAAPAVQRFDDNQFGTDEFVRFCRLVGGRPYLAANVRSLPGEAFDRWVEYCNAPAHSTTLADMRAAAGSAEPFGVRYWGIGNEAWGCGGNFTADEYASEFCRYTAAVPDYGVGLRFVASGPDKDDWSWTRGFFEAIARRGKDELRSIFGFSLHYYTWNLSRGRTNDWVQGKGDALSFAPVDWYELLREGGRIESLIEAHWNIMGQTDADHAVKLVIDEWGSWYRAGSEVTPFAIFEQVPTLRDALFSAMTLDIFNRHPEKIAMANCAQLINCLNSLYLARDDEFCVTPVGHVFGMYAAHQGGKAVRADVCSPEVTYERDGQPARLWGLRGSASLHDKTLVLTVVNPHVAQARVAEVRVGGASCSGALVTVLTHADIRGHNTFATPDEVRPVTHALAVAGATVRFTFPAASVTKLELALV